LLSLGIAHWQANELREAVTAFSEGTRRFPADYRFFYFYGLTSQKLIEVSGGGAAGFESARTALQRSIALNPEFPNSHFILGKIWAKTGQTQQAQKEFERTVSLNPNHVEVKYWLSKIYRQSGRNKEAAKLEGEVQAARRQKLEEESQMRIVLVRK
jgi:tetratricopeptide (TPR) repeat protein